MPNRITTQDIADALGVSRNTVSKAINNSGILSEATRQKVIEKPKRWDTVSFPGSQLQVRTFALLKPMKKSRTSGEENYSSEFLLSERFSFFVPPA